MALTREQAISDWCSFASEVYHAIGEYLHPNDSFCRECAIKQTSAWNFQNDGFVLSYVRAAVVEKLVSEGRIDSHKGLMMLGVTSEEEQT